jgi:hypothetical protein
MQNQRKKIWIDRLQTHLALRLALYLGCFQAALWVLFLIEGSLRYSFGSVLGSDGPRICFVLLSVPVFLLGLATIYDSLLFSHRLAGPIYRFRQVIKAITAGEPVDLVKLRQGDMLLEMRDEFNDLLRALEERGAVVLKTPPAANKPEPAEATR